MSASVIQFQSRYRAAFHFRPQQRRERPRHIFRFNLVIERLFISGKTWLDKHDERFRQFQSRYRAAFHFRFSVKRLQLRHHRVSISLSSGFSFQAPEEKCNPSASLWFQVSISLSSGFSFQVEDKNYYAHYRNVSISLSSGFSFQDPRHRPLV